MTRSFALNSPTTISALVCLFIIGAMFFLLMPLYVGALADYVGLNNQQIGTLSSLELFGSCLASLSGLLWIRKANWQTMAFICGFALLGLNMLSMLATESLALLIFLRIGAGFSSGCLLAIAIAALGDTARLDRNFALAIAGQLAVSGLLFFVLPQMVLLKGVNAVFGTFATCALAALAACAFVPPRGKEQAQQLWSGGVAWRPLWGLAGSMSFFIAQTAVWAFIERMGVQAEFSADFIGIALGVSTIVAIAAALGVGWLSQTVGRFRLMLFATLGELACLVALLDGFSATTYFVAVVLFQICWNGCVPIQMANIAAIDVSGRFTVLIGLFQAMGIAAGPVLVAQLLTGGSFLPVNIVSGVFVILALLLFWPIAVQCKSTEQV